ncbi:DUF5988 family protein [Nocardia sp. NBC_01503]|uniref:DUF5988 family protein n=1 Tax=Nocardia sp. NBC_01503 TaxID=2975997 RepID=UPI002E7BBFAF|nr:DUF5988 family protein [Nocardia sp. NBC_01503]WTL32160.1 DUF5988 family protein [Nocardia sp. NBC_01503]
MIPRTRLDLTQQRADGPSGIPNYWTINAAATSLPVKVPRLSGYEHFDPTDSTVTLDGTSLPVFRWAYRTRIAE